MKVIERERVRRGWPWSSAEIAEAARLAYENDWTRSEIVAFIECAAAVVGDSPRA